MKICILFSITFGNNKMNESKIEENLWLGTAHFHCSSAVVGCKKFSIAIYIIPVLNFNARVYFLR